VIGPETSRNGIVAIDVHAAWSDIARGASLARTRHRLSRVVMRPWGGVRRSTRRDHKA
jgi:hypothetical protein